MLFENLTQFELWLNSFFNFEKTPQKNVFWLKNMEFFANEFNNPQNTFKIIHVAGSKGKGSVCHFTANMLKENGYKTGLYTSPHLFNFFERITLAGKLFSKSSYLKAANELYSKKTLFEHDFITKECDTNKRKVTWFEIVTLYAFLVFRQENCRYVVLETGLGGRLDATNISNPVASIITPIELEHCDFLGNTIEKIAYEKAGIIKNKTPVFVSKQKLEAKKIFETVAAEKKSEIYFFEDFVKKIEYKMQKTEKGRIYLEFCKPNIKFKTKISMIGKIQSENAAIASFCLINTVPKISIKKLCKGIEKTLIPARFEIKKINGIKTVFDGAHTINSLNFTIETFEKIFSKKNIILFACAKDKNMEEMAKSIAESSFEHIILTKPGTQKSSNLPGLMECFDKLNCPYKWNEDPKKAFELALKTAKKCGKKLLICGSFYLIAEIKKK